MSKFSHTRANYDARASKPDPVNKIMCRICGLWYKKPLSHVAQRHGIYKREYKEVFGYDVGKGIVTKDLHKRFVQMGKDNPSWPVNLLIKGAKYRFKSEDSRRKYKRSEQTKERLSLIGEKGRAVRKLKKVL